MKCVPLEKTKGRNFLFLKIGNKNAAQVQVYVSGMTEAPLTLCHAVMRGKRPCKKHPAIVECQRTRQKRAKTVISLRSDSNY
jgi:hypothetical protein